MEDSEPSRRDRLTEELVETQRLIDRLRDAPESPKQERALEELARIQLRIVRLLAEGEDPSAN